MPRASRPRELRVLSSTFVLLVVLVAGAGCAGGTSGKACGPVLRETLDPQSLTHVLPNGKTPAYSTDPPTSGAHQPAPPLTGVQQQPLPKPVQVGLLEAGKVLVQYRGLGAHDVASLRRFAGSRVVVAPTQSDLGRDHVVLTAWTVKQRCAAVDTAAIAAFVRVRAGHGPGTP